jgi:hypothetical protein
MRTRMTVTVRMYSVIRSGILQDTDTPSARSRTKPPIALRVIS